jgi:small subunit ribosomal protein S17
MSETKLRTLQGQVVSNKADKTITVSIVRYERHPLYGKYVKKTLKCHAHDENNICGIGDKVAVMETRPLSATKRWRLVEIIEKAK